MIDRDYIDDLEMEHVSKIYDGDYMVDLSEFDDESGSRGYHDLIKRYQKSLSSNTSPSKTESVYWLYADREKGRYQRSTKNSGKWLIFTPEASIDELWSRVKKATEAGLLGNDSKVSTQKARNGRDFVICVYTYDWTHKEDCMRIREELRKMGVVKKIPYKADADTLAGKYAVEGRLLSKYYE